MSSPCTQMYIQLIIIIWASTTLFRLCQSSIYQANGEWYKRMFKTIVFTQRNSEPPPWIPDIWPVWPVRQNACLIVACSNRCCAEIRSGYWWFYLPSSQPLACCLWFNCKPSKPSSNATSQNRLDSCPVKNEQNSFRNTEKSELTAEASHSAVCLAQFWPHSAITLGPDMVHQRWSMYGPASHEADYSWASCGITTQKPCHKSRDQDSSAILTPDLVQVLPGYTNLESSY